MMIRQAEVSMLVGYTPVLYAKRAMPMPFFSAGEVWLNTSYSRRFRSQSEALRPRARHSSSPLEQTVNLPKGS